MMTFKELGLSQALVEAITKLGFETPTPIQEQAIPVLLQENRDMVALAQTGTGKTAAFGLPMLEKIDVTNRSTQALVLAPTRELCLQITNDLENFCKDAKGVHIVPIYGGASIVEQIKKVKRGAHIVVATPGRLMDMMDRKAVSISDIQLVVLDEADEMLNMGFKDDIDTILADTPDEKKVWLFSATMPKEVRAIANAYMSFPLEITVGNKNQGNVNIEHQYIVVEERERYAALKRIVDYNIDIFAVIFCRTKLDTQKIAENLIRDGYNADALHGDLTQQQRDKVMKSFKDKTLQFLVATDVAARGIDVSNITHVINLNLPDEIEFYTHRSGRTARAGKQGISLAIITKRELGKIKQIEKVVNTKFQRINIPTGAEVCQKRLIHLIHRLRDVKVNETELAPLMPSVYEELQGLTKEEVIKRFTFLEFNHLLDYYRDAPDLNKSERPADTFAKQERFVTGTRLFINIGKMDGLDAGKLLGMICDRCGVTRSVIGRIDLKGAYSFIEVEEEVSQLVQSNLHGMEYKGRMVRVEITQEKERSGRSGGGNRSRSERTDRGERTERRERSEGNRYGKKEGSRYSDSTSGKFDRTSKYKDNKYSSKDRKTKPEKKNEKFSKWD
ncbi:MAG: DEAD/DEAH box helicase [Cyclobacteriaceae bacterium]|nr:DEAD/DEAH box helicase [Flammeovirgaceae bacterium]MCZ8022660.1 DEAD/DEAH box helicase [Cytophagales bacterium]MCZ8328859.1 DEAD/DEAH box helicase [Cyclobacteriaceae bacterium]